MGHGTIAITFDLYGHLMPGAHGEAAGLLDPYLARGADAEADTDCSQSAAHLEQTQA